MHTFRNPFDDEARVISVVSPAGLERYYQALADLPPGPKDISVLQAIMADFGIELRLPAGEPVVRVGIIGAGVAGLVTAKVLTEVGPRRRRLRPHARRRRRLERDPALPGAVDAEPEGDTYTLSDFPMPADLPRVADRASRCRPTSRRTPRTVRRRPAPAPGAPR